MSSYIPLPQPPSSKFLLDELEEPLNDIPSNLDLALNGGTNQTFLSPNNIKSQDPSLLDPEAFRRLSISTISSYSRARSVSRYPYTPPNPPSRRKTLTTFWHQNQGLFLVTFSQLFGASMNVAARLLELEGEGMAPTQLLFVRQGLTVILCTGYMWWAKVPGFPLGRKENGLRKLLVARACTGFFGIYGMYCKFFYIYFNFLE
jgi:hypothetical protein